MGNSSEKQSLTSQIIKILRVTTEPLSANAISEIYQISYAKVKKTLTELKEDRIVFSIKTGRGEFYFIPEKYLNRGVDLLETEETMPYIWYEELSERELMTKKNNIIKTIKETKKKYKAKKISSIEYFKTLQEKSEELSIVTQILEDRKAEKTKHCYYCGEDIEERWSSCPYCDKDVPICSVCKRGIYANEELVACPKCKTPAHKNHLIEWLKAIGSCPKCKDHIVESKLIAGEKFND